MFFIMVTAALALDAHNAEWCQVYTDLSPLCLAACATCSDQQGAELQQNN